MSTTDRLTPGALMAWFDQAMNQSDQHANDVILSWKELLFTKTCVRLPDNVSECISDSIIVQDGLSVLNHPVERDLSHVWVSGPQIRQTLQAPLELRILNEAGFLTFDMTFYWSIWTDEQSEGYRQRQQALERLQYLGWVYKE